MPGLWQYMIMYDASGEPIGIYDSVNGTGRATWFRSFVENGEVKVQELPPPASADFGTRQAMVNAQAAELWALQGSAPTYVDSQYQLRPLSQSSAVPAYSPEPADTASVVAATGVTPAVAETALTAAGGVVDTAIQALQSGASSSGLTQSYNIAGMAIPLWALLIAGFLILRK